MEGSKGDYRISFPDIASRGSQTEPVSPNSWTTSLPETGASQIKKRSSGHPMRPIPHRINASTPPWLKSRLVMEEQTSESSASPRKKRRAIPFSNRPCEAPCNPPIPTEFDLGNFCFTALPDPHGNEDRYNDDLTIEPYAPSERSYSGKQRKGISEPFPDATTHMEHIKAALAAKFPLNEDIPIPTDLRIALEFNRDNSSRTVADFRTKQLNKLRVIAEECRQETERWYSFTDPKIASATGTVHIALLTHLSRFTRMRGTNWLMQFVTGFPIVGHLHQAGVYNTDDTPVPKLTSPESLFATKTARFKARAPRSVSRSSQQLWDEALQQAEAGWLSPPELLDSDGNFKDNPNEKCNIAFRFGVSQSDKLRGCDDFRDSMTNTACHISTPITLPGWDHIAAAAKILSLSQRPWAFGKIDHRAAYKALPLRPSHIPYAVIALWNPQKREWFAFRPRTQLFGSIAAVLNYNCLSRLIASLACRILLIPTIGYFDDFGFFVSANDADSAMNAFNEFFDIIGFELKREKSAIGQVNTFLGLTAHFPNPSNDMKLSLTLSPDKAEKWSDSIIQIIEERQISHARLESLIGRLAFAQTAVFGRFARAMLKPLYAKLYSPRYFAPISQSVLRNLSWWAASLSSLRPRIVDFSRSTPDWVIYSDASYEQSPLEAHMAAIFFQISQGIRIVKAELVMSSSPSAEEIAFFTSTSIIFGLELSAIVLALFQAREMLRGKAVTIYVDNNAALAALINGDSSSSAAFSLIATFWYIAASHNIALWFERVHTSNNIADLPTRGRSLPFPVGKTEGYPHLAEALSFYSRKIANYAPSLAELNLTRSNLPIAKEEAITG